MSTAEIVGSSTVLDRSADDLCALVVTTESEVSSVADVFQQIVGLTDSMMEMVASIIECVEGEQVASVRPRVQELGEATSNFLKERLVTIKETLRTVHAEVPLLYQLSALALDQRTIAKETHALSLLTSIEVARLGEAGSGFTYLANELAEFSQSVARDTTELRSQTDSRLHSIEAMERELAAGLPRLQQEFGNIEARLAAALEEVSASLRKLVDTPVHFRACVQEIARQVAGVVAAIQAQDITRQQMEHVEQALRPLSAQWELREQEAGESLPQLSAGLTIQRYQLKSIRETVAGWASQINNCLEAILQISVSELVGIGPLVMAQQHALSEQLLQIESLENDCLAYDDKIKRSHSGLLELIKLVSEHLLRSQAVRERLQLLTFNSIVEASHLGGRVEGIRAISLSIKEIATAWGRMTDKSQLAIRQILQLVNHSSELNQSLALDSNSQLHQAQAQSRNGLQNLKSAASCSACLASNIKEQTGALNTKIADARDLVHRLESSLSTLDGVLRTVESFEEQLEGETPGLSDLYDHAEAERLFSASYTTEIERKILRAALTGAALPQIEHSSFDGNSVELF